MIPLILAILPFIWAPVGDSYVKVDIEFLQGPEIKCGNAVWYSGVNGCFWQNGDERGIRLIEAEMFEYNPIGCNTWTHEAWHAFGYVHGEGPLVLCEKHE
jgi:hypothetical protein